jgi:hypothetical protein
VSNDSKDPIDLNAFVSSSSEKERVFGVDTSPQTTKPISPPTSAYCTGSDRRWAIAKWLLTVLVVIAGLGTWHGYYTSKTREILRLPEQERRVLYEHTKETLQTVCMHPTGPSVRDYCHEQAEFILRFPECDEACSRIVDSLPSRATR